MKSDLRLPWYQMRKLTRWLKHLGITMQSECCMCEKIADKLPIDLTAERRPTEKVIVSDAFHSASTPSNSGYCSANKENTLV